MSVATRRRRARNRQLGHALLQGGKWLLIIAVFIAIGYGAHEAGTRLANLEVDRLKRQLAELEQRYAQLGSEAGRLRADLDAATARGQQIQQRYDADVPRGALAGITSAVRERLAAGVNGERIRQAVRGAEALRRCDGPAISRRFRIGVGRATDDDATSFAEGMIRVGAVMPATSDDVARTTVVTFSGLGSGGTRTVTGLPAEHVLLLDNAELRLVVSESPVRGFATATLTTCRIPG